MSAHDVITAEIANDSDLGGSFYVLRPGNTAFYSNGMGNSAYITNLVTTPGTYSIEISPNGGTGTAKLKVIFPVNLQGTVSPRTSLATATPTAVSITNPGQNPLYAFTITAGDVSAHDVITAQIS